MIYVSVPKEIKEFEERIIGPLTWRQLKYMILSLVVGVVLYFASVKILGPDMAGWIVMFSVVPIFGAGYAKKQGVYLDAYYKIVFEFKTRRQRLFYDSGHFDQDRRTQRVSKKEKKLSKARLESEH